MQRKFHGQPTDAPLGFDHVSFTVATRRDLFHLKDKLEAAGVEVTGAVDHGTVWSIYFYDPNNIPLEVSWDCMEILKPPAMDEEEPMDIVAEGARAQPGVWPEVTSPTPPEDMVASPGNGVSMRDTFLKQGVGRVTKEYRDIGDGRG